jgi:hypothetical protein
MNVIEALELAKKDGKKIRRQCWGNRYVVHIDLHSLFTTSSNGQVKKLVIPIYTGGSVEGLLPVPSGLVCVRDTFNSTVTIEPWQPEISDLDAQDWEIVPARAAPGENAPVPTEDVPTINPDVP